MYFSATSLSKKLANGSDCSPLTTNSTMDAPSKTFWPGTYLGRLQAVTAELRKIGVPTSADSLMERFSGVTDEQIEATLEALVLFGKIDKKGHLFSVIGERGEG
jgi:hypothetical protein